MRGVGIIWPRYLETAHFKPLHPNHVAVVIPVQQLDSIAKIVGERVTAGAPITAAILPLAEARKQGAMMLFGEKYPDPVRMISMGEFSRVQFDNVSVDGFEIDATSARFNLGFTWFPMGGR